MTAEKEYLIVCDESDRNGKFFGHFYGGLRIGMSQLGRVKERLQNKKAELGLNSEMKWEKTDPTVVERYEKMIKAFFDEIAAGRLVVRIMFTQNAQIPTGLTAEHIDSEYYILYYQFLKHCFGLRHMPGHSPPPKFKPYPEVKWSMPHLHWLFKPNNHEFDNKQTKSKKKRSIWTYISL